MAVPGFYDDVEEISDEEAALFRDAAPECAERVVVIRNGVDSDYFSPAHDLASPFGSAALMRTVMMPPSLPANDAETQLEILSALGTMKGDSAIPQIGELLKKKAASQYARVGKLIQEIHLKERQIEAIGDKIRRYANAR